MKHHIWYNPFKKYLIIGLIDSDKNNVYYTRKQIIIKDLEFIWYYTKYIIIFLLGKFTNNLTDNIIDYLSKIFI